MKDGKGVWAAPGPEQQARGQLSGSGRLLITQLGTERRKHTEPKICARQRAGRVAASSAQFLSSRGREKTASVGVFSVSSLLSVSSSTFGAILEELSSAVALANEPWHCPTAKRAHSHS